MKKIFLLVSVLVFVGFGCSAAQEVEPIFTGTTTDNEEVSDSNIIVDYPVEGGVVTSPLVIRGSARTFEKNVQWSMKTLDGVELASGFTTADSPDVGEFGDFSIRTFLPVIEHDSFYLEVFETSPKYGDQEDLVRMELVPEESGKTTVQVFFIDDAPTLDGLPPVADFEKRTTHRTVNVAEFAILELLKGPESAWASQYIPEGTTLNRLEIRAGKASVYFDNEETPNWCSGINVLTAREDQIRETLAQFPTVTDVDTYINDELFDCAHP
jgi:hypothetical protein